MLAVVLQQVLGDQWTLGDVELRLRNQQLRQRVLEARAPPSKGRLGVQRVVVDRLPWELVEEIMTLCAEASEVDEDLDCPGTNPNAKLGNTLSHVSRSWRSVALNMPTLWTTVILDTIKPIWFLELLERAGRKCLSFYSTSMMPSWSNDRDGIHVWTIARANIDRMKHISTTINVDSHDTRVVGEFLSRKAPVLETCSIKYTPYDDEEVVEGLCRTVMGHFNTHADDICNSQTLFSKDAPRLKTLQLVDCHYPRDEAIFPSITHFDTLISIDNDQCEYGLMRDVEAFLLTMGSHSSLVSLTLVNAVRYTNAERLDQLFQLPPCPLPHLRMVDFTGPLFSGSQLLRLLQPGGPCSYKLSLDMDEDEGPPVEALAKCFEGVLQPISNLSDPQTWAIVLHDGDEVIEIQAMDDLASYDLHCTTTDWAFDASAIRDHSIWKFPQAEDSPTPEDEVDLSYSCLLRVLARRHRRSLQAATELRVHFSGSDFSFQQTSYLFQHMNNIVDFGIESYNLSLEPIERALLPTHRAPVFPKLQNICLPLDPPGCRTVADFGERYAEKRREASITPIEVTQC